MREETYSGPRTDISLTVGYNCQGDEVLVSGTLDVQAWHDEDGSREIWLVLYRDDIELDVKCRIGHFGEGDNLKSLFKKVPFGLVDLPEPGFHVYTLTWRVVDPNGGPAYTGTPHFNNVLRVRELCL